MKVYLMRHSHAIRENADLNDGARHLSADGRQLARDIGAKLSEEGVSFDVMLSSPLVRAIQTAELVASALGHLGVIESLNGLAPGCEPQIAARTIGARGVDIALVSHEPTVSALGAFLLGAPSFQPFRPGQVCCIEDGRGVWKLLPHVLQFEALNA